jgi:pentatricopeptide repeat protein
LRTSKVYNYFLCSFAKTGNVELGMNFCSKMIVQHWQPNLLELVVHMIKEMLVNRFGSDQAPFLIHLLCQSICLRKHVQNLRSFRERYRPETNDPSVDHVCSKSHDKTTMVPHKTTRQQSTSCDSASY